MAIKRKNRAKNVNVLDAVKAAAAKLVGKLLEDRQLTQTEAAYIMRDAPSQISLVVTGKLRGFSFDRVMRFLSRLSVDIHITFTERKDNRPGKVTFEINRAA